MKHKNILLRTGTILILLAAVVSLFNSCTKKDQAGQVDFTIDLTNPQYSQLSAYGVAVDVQGVNIVNLGSGYIALSAYCTYDQSVLTFNGSTLEFVCPGDQSQFNTDGSVKFGNATIPLTKYNVQVYGSSLRVYL